MAVGRPDIELRERKHEVEYDKNNICFICNLERYQFDKFADGFETHVKRDHNLWRYLYFLYGLQKKDSSDYSGLESFVASQIFTDRKDWLPLGRALSLEVASL